ncbi:MAG TPA: glycerol-3-phosphate 1-O-acyltransferase PlsY [Candidatus Binatia bacterium]|nr:glycerol-3-phosphate 1-O-acyltransferase PlsY [Candidatus Binatia bacterium]
MAIPLLLLAYVLGSVPTGVLLSRTVGIDPRRAGSGNIGATNVARTAGRWLGLLTLLGDALKGALPVWLAQRVTSDPALPAFVGLATIAGHLWSCFLQFRGGKGVATAFGVFLMLAPSAVGIALIGFLVTAVATRYVSLASMVAAGVLPLSSFALAGNGWIAIAALLTALAIIGKHRDNARRLVSGTEPKFGSTRAQESGAAR